jgi:hypothetical protein
MQFRAGGEGAKKELEDDKGEGPGALSSSNPENSVRTEDGLQDK